MNKAIHRIVTASLAACALALTLSGGVRIQTASAAPQATPMPTPAATTAPSPLPTPVPMPATPMASPAPNPNVTPAGNPAPTAPSPGTDMLNSNPNGSAWLQKFNRVPTPEPAARSAMPAGHPVMPAGHPAMPAHPLSAKCRALMKAWAGKTINAAQHARLKAACMR